MRRPTIAYMDNGLPVQCLSERDFLFPDADEKYVPDTRAYIQSYDVPAFHALLRAGSPEDAIAAFPYLSDREKTFALRGYSRTGRKNWRAFTDDHVMAHRCRGAGAVHPIKNYARY